MTNFLLDLPCRGVSRNIDWGREGVGCRPLSFPIAPSPSLPSSLPLHVPPPLRSRPPILLEGLGERCKLPSGFWGGAPAEIEFGMFWP